jgi:hypothetical protein
MNEQLRQNRDRAVQRFLEGGLNGTLYVTLCADDLLDGDLYWDASPLAFIAKQCVLVLDDTVATIDGGVLIVCLRELRKLGFSFAVPDDMSKFQSPFTQRPVVLGVGDSGNDSQSASSPQLS